MLLFTPLEILAVYDGDDTKVNIYCRLKGGLQNPIISNRIYLPPALYQHGSGPAGRQVKK